MVKEISYVMAPEDHFYTGMVMRRVTSTLDNGQRLVLSETTTGMELDEFQQKNPNTPVDGQRGRTLSDEVSYMTDEQLAAMGLTRLDGSVRQERPKKEEEVLTPKLTYPSHEGYGWYMLSSGVRAKGKAEALRRQKLIDEGDPDPEDYEAMTAPPEQPEEKAAVEMRDPLNQE